MTPLYQVFDRQTGLIAAVLTEAEIERWVDSFVEAGPGEALDWAWFDRAWYVVPCFGNGLVN